MDKTSPTSCEARITFASDYGKELIVGNREGLEELHIAVTEALKSGEYLGKVGGLHGVRCVDGNIEETLYNWKSQLLPRVVLLAIASLAVIGLFQIGSWLRNI